MALLVSKEQVNEIRERAKHMRTQTELGMTQADDVRQLTADIDTLLRDLAASPPLVLIAPDGSSQRERAEIMRQAAQSHRGPVYVLPSGWCEANEEQAETLARRMSHIEMAVRIELSKEIRAILAENRLDQYGAVFQIGELCGRLEGKP